MNTVSAAGEITALGGAGSDERSGSAPAFEGKASYAWTGDVAGKVWASAISQKVEGLGNGVAVGYGQAAIANTVTSAADRATAWDIGTNVNVAGFGLTAYYGQGKGIGQTVQLLNGFDAAGKRRDSDQWYVQATYALPTATKIGVAYGESTLDGNRGEFKDIKHDMWTVGAYHPLTKSVNLVAEYSEANNETNNRGATANTDLKAKTVSLGAILFF